MRSKPNINTNFDHSQKKPAFLLVKSPSILPRLSQKEENDLFLNKLRANTPAHNTIGNVVDNIFNRSPKMGATLSSFNFRSKPETPAVYSKSPSHGYFSRKSPAKNDPRQNYNQSAPHNKTPDKFSGMVPLSQFLFQTNDEKSESKTEEKDYFRMKTTNQSFLSGRPFTVESNSTRNSSSQGFFKTQLPMKAQLDPKKALEEIERIGTQQGRMRTSYRMDTVSSITNVQESVDEPAFVKQLKNEKVFRVRTDAVAKYKSKLDDIKSKQQKIKQDQSEGVNRKIIMQNKNRIMICQHLRDADLNYFFIDRINPVHIAIKSSESKLRSDILMKKQVQEIQIKMKLDPSYRFIYRLNGQPLYDFSQLPRTEMILLISQHREMFDGERILDHQFVKDFYEYVNKKDISIYDKSHMQDKLLEEIQAEELKQKKFEELIYKIDGENQQFNSEKLEEMIQSVRKGKNISEKLSELYARKSSKEDAKFLMGSKGNSREMSPITANRASVISTKRGSRENIRIEEDEDQNLEKVLKEMDELENKMLIENENKEDEPFSIENYIKSKKLLSSNEKLNQTKKILKIYKDNIKTHTIPIEEPENLQNAEGMHEGEKEELLEISEKIPALVRRFNREKKKWNYFQIKDELADIKAKEGMKKEKEREIEINALGEDILAGGDKKKEEPVKNTIIQDQIKKLRTKREDIRDLFKTNKDLYSKNIPKYLAEYGLTRKELHYIYVLYKTLCEVTSQRYKDYNIEDGIDYYSFKNGIYQVFLQTDAIAEKIFYQIDVNFSGFLNWDEFLSAMVKIRAKTMRDKIDLFIKLADEDGNGNLSKEEIFKLAKIALAKSVTADDGFLDDLCEYFTKLIFQTVGIPMDEEIPLIEIKKCIVEGKQEGDLLAMFCGADL